MNLTPYFKQSKKQNSQTLDLKSDYCKKGVNKLKKHKINNINNPSVDNLVSTSKKANTFFNYVSIFIGFLLFVLAIMSFL